MYTPQRRHHLPFAILAMLMLIAVTSYGQERPFVRWWWNGDKVDTTELKRELHLLHNAGIGGVEINPIEFPSKRCDSLGIASFTWLSDQWIEVLGVVLREARSLGMQCDLIVGSGWPFGTENLPMEHRAQVMLTYATEVVWEDGQPFVLTKQQIFDAVDPKVTVPNADRTFELVDLFVVPDSVSGIHQRTPSYPTDSDTIKIYPIEQILNTWPHSENGKYMLYALVRCTSFASVINGAPGASGPILDHMNNQAVEQFLLDMSSRLERVLGPMRQWLRAYFVDSMELEGSNWTDDFASEFRRRRGYDLMPWLPFTMFKVGRLGEAVSYRYGAKQSPEFERQVQRVRHDFELTKAELLHERFTETFVEWCHKQGVKARSQAYGRGFFPMLGSMAMDIPEGESWTTNYLRHRVGYEMPDSDYRRGRAYTMINKYVSSAARISGKPIISAEEMTNTYMLFNTPLELLKIGSDMSAFSGITHSVWHGFNYNPPQAGFPGWVQYGSYYNEQNTWWPYFHLLNDYRTRVSHLMQGCDMYTPVAVLTPTADMWGEIGVQTEPFPNYPRGSRYEVTPLLWEAIHKNGSGCDLLTPFLLHKASVVDGKLHCGKRRYSVVLVPDTSLIPDNEAERIIASFAASGGKVVRVPNLPDRDYLDWYCTEQQQLSLPHSVDIANPDRFLLHNSYTDRSGQRIYLFANAHLDTAITAQLHFPEEVWLGYTAWVYDPGRDCHYLLPTESGNATLHLGPAETVIIRFAKHNVPAERTAQQWPPTPHPSSTSHTLHSKWNVHLHHAIERWQRDTVLDTLADLRQTQFADFAGTATYSTTIVLDSLPQYIDLGAVHDICQIEVNGTDCGVQWYGQRIYRIGHLLHPGKNEIRITVTTLLGNYARTLTDNGVINHFVTKRNLPTVPAGLIGPVSIIYTK